MQVPSGGMIMAVHARPAGLRRLRRTINSWLEEISFRTAVAACVAALLLIVAAAAIALVSGHGTAAGAARSDPAGTPGTSAAMPAASPTPRAIAVPSASPAPPALAAPALRGNRGRGEPGLAYRPAPAVRGHLDRPAGVRDPGRGDAGDRARRHPAGRRHHRVRGRSVQLLAPAMILAGPRVVPV